MTAYLSSKAAEQQQTARRTSTDPATTWADDQTSGEGNDNRTGPEEGTTHRRDAFGGQEPRASGDIFTVLPTTPAGTPTLASPHRQRGRAVRAPGDIYIAVRTDGTGTVVHAAGPFAEESEAKIYTEIDYGGRGYVAPFELIFRRPRP